MTFYLSVPLRVRLWRRLRTIGDVTLLTKNGPKKRKENKTLVSITVPRQIHVEGVCEMQHDSYHTHELKRLWGESVAFWSSGWGSTSKSPCLGSLFLGLFGLYSYIVRQRPRHLR